MAHYFRSSEAAILGELQVVKSKTRTYGYSIRNVAQGVSFSWYLRKRDAQAFIDKLHTCPNYLRAKEAQ